MRLIEQIRELTEAIQIEKAPSGRDLPIADMLEWVVVFDPQDETVFWTTFQQGQRTFNMQYSVELELGRFPSSSADLSPVVDVLKKSKRSLQKIAAGHSVEFKNGNRVGELTRDAYETWQDLRREFRDLLDYEAIPRFWDAGNWLAGDIDTSLADAAKYRTLRDAAKAAADEAKEMGAHIDVDEAEEVLRVYLEDGVEEVNDEIYDVGLAGTLVAQLQGTQIEVHDRKIRGGSSIAVSGDNARYLASAIADVFDGVDPRDHDAYAEAWSDLARQMRRYT